MTPLNSEIKAPGGQCDPSFLIDFFPPDIGVADGRKSSRAHAREIILASEEGVSRVRRESFLATWSRLASNGHYALCASDYGANHTSTELVPLTHTRCSSNIS